MDDWITGSDYQRHINTQWGDTVMAKWIEYTGSAAQIEEIYNNECMLRLPSGNEVSKSKFVFVSDLPKILETISHYLICEPHPYADIIKIWADTGCEVYTREHHDNYYDGVLESTDYYDLPPTDKPNWSIPGAEYRLTPFED